MSFKSTAELIFYAVSHGLVTEMAAAQELNTGRSSESSADAPARSSTGIAAPKPKSVSVRPRTHAAPEKRR